MLYINSIRSGKVHEKSHELSYKSHTDKAISTCILVITNQLRSVPINLINIITLSKHLYHHVAKFYVQKMNSFTYSLPFKFSTVHYVFIRDIMLGIFIKVEQYLCKHINYC